MIHSLAILVALCAPPPAANAPAPESAAPEPAAPESAAPESAAPESAAPAADPAARKAVDTSINAYRSSYDALTERAIGRASRAVRFDWRRGTLQAGIIGGLPVELNNFDALRAGLFVRLPTERLMFEWALSWVFVSGSEATDSLALTPYRQAARPDHLELDFSVGYPIAEGVITPVPGALPAAQLVLKAEGQFRYLIYPTAWSGLTFLEGLRAVFRGRLEEQELNNLEDIREPGMEIDPARYSLWGGFSTDIFFQSGLFFSQKVIVAIPLLARPTRTNLFFGFELSLSTGFAF